MILEIQLESSHLSEPEDCYPEDNSSDLFSDKVLSPRLTNSLFDFLSFTSLFAL